MKRRATIASWFGGWGHLEGCPHTNNREPEKGTVVKPDSIVVHPGAKVRLTIKEGSPGHEEIFEPKGEGWTCNEIVRLREKGRVDHKEELLASNPGTTYVEFSLELESYTTEEVHFSRGQYFDPLTP